MAKYRIMTQRKFGDPPRYGIQKRELFFWTWVWDGGYIRMWNTYAGAESYIFYLKSKDSKWRKAEEK